MLSAGNSSYDTSTLQTVLKWAQTAALLSRYETQSEEFSSKDEGDEAPCPHQRVLQSDVSPGAAFIPAGWTGHDGGRHVSGPRTGQ